MYLAPEGDEIEIADAAADFLAQKMPIDRLHKPGAADMSETLRELLGEMGWFGLAVPAERGGSGLSPVEHALFFREVGRQCGPVDLLAQALAANAAQDTGLRQSIISGSRGVALMVADGDGYRLFGSDHADLALIVTRERAQLHPLEQAALESRAALDPANSLRVADALPDAVDGTSGETIWRLGELGAAAMLVGLAEAALDLIVEYAKVREAFGRPIGAYQAVRHTCADMAVRIEAARSQLWFAAAALKEGRGDAGAHLDAAKHLANEAGMACADSNIQLHGGIGVSEEHDAHLLLKHAMLLSRLFGSKRSLLARLLEARLED
ncbi:MAG: acyl-CoA dehydrogenase family protein [Novosphingobium sp.]|nr:acyl-CoA dehydrogenase family protein [Novosphingobium sp.]MCP5403662.1 acyl-CoA dehydrogenase family protein [Novosphingobium sp.]